MRSGLALAAAGIAVLVLQGGVASILPRGLCPDLSLLFVLAVGVHARHPKTARRERRVLGAQARRLRVLCRCGRGCAICGRADRRSV